MKRNRCPRRPEISLLAAGALDEEEKNELECHLAACPECRAYSVEIEHLVEPLAAWDKSLSGVEVTAAARLRWDKAIKNDGAASAVRPSALQAAWRIVWQELILPSRYAWTGMAALWLAMLVINGNLSDHQAGDAGRVAASSQEMIRNWEEQNRVLAELSQPSFGFVAPVPPPSVLKPRSEREEGWRMV